MFWLKELLFSEHNLILAAFLKILNAYLRKYAAYLLRVRDITGIPVYLDLGVLRYVSRYAFDVPVHSTNFINFWSIVYLLSFRAVIYLHGNIYLTSLDN